MLSVVIVHWNTPDLLEHCLISVYQAAERVATEIVVVDCASTVGNAREIVGAFELTKLVQLSENHGYASGCNAGAAATSGELVLFLNADTEVTPGALDLLVGCFDLNPRVGLVAPLLLNADQSIQSSGYAFPGAMNILCDLAPVPDRMRGSRLNGRIDPGNGFHPYAVDYALGAALAVRRPALEQVGGWDESYGMYAEEIELARRLNEAGWTRLIEPRARVLHFGGASTGQRPVEMQSALWRSRGRYHRRWSSPGRQRLLRALVSAGTRVGGVTANPTAVCRAFAEGLGR